MYKPNSSPRPDNRAIGHLLSHETGDTNETNDTGETTLLTDQVVSKPK